ncbi:sensor histidine kinase [Sporosarcina sp. ACRSM]|uniref:sensor histidine kinase n=1 Tax=Sporosarcina sp. ACRSM TaxID=2918216 RepID=UPI001EF64C48|nr:sensor histidine kinase [Sporosarcina sp. ACRSM]
MKANLKTNIIHALLFLMVLGLTGYFTLTILQFPLVGMKVKQEDQHWIVAQIHESGWASSQPIEEGNIVELVNGEQTDKHPTVRRFARVEMAESVTIIDQDLKSHTYPISYGDMASKEMFYLLFPLLFAAVTISLSIFLYVKMKNDRSAIILIYFLVSLGLSYIGAFTSGRGDVVGRVLTIITLPGTIILFMQFLNRYFSKYGLVFIKTTSLVRLYMVYLFFLFIIAANQFFPVINKYISEFKLLFFSSLVFYFLFYLIRFYMKYKNSEGKAILKILGATVFLAFGPFSFFYAVPTILFHKAFLPSEITMIALIIIPIAIVYLQVAEKLFDIEFFLDRLRYYSFNSLLFTILIILLLRFAVGIQLPTSMTAMVFIVLFICTLIFIYVKEYLDYKLRHHLFSQKGDFGMGLYTFFQKTKYETKVSSLVTKLEQEIRDVLLVKKVIYAEVFREGVQGAWTLKEKHEFPASLAQEIAKVNWDHYRIGTIIEVMNGFLLVIGGDNHTKKIFFLGMKKQKTNFNIQERIWLETLAHISSILFENLQLIEDLIEEIENYKVKDNDAEKQHYPFWLSRLLFSLAEKERANLSIDLHDSVLQDQLQLLREVEKISGKVNDHSIKHDLVDLKERMLDNIHLIRETCNELRPPFLNELGIIQSLQNLVDQTKLRSNFILKSELDPSIRTLDPEYELVLYRVVQELLNNAMKHSLATEVQIALSNNDHSLSLSYCDDGIGIDMLKLNDSFKTMGIFGMKERIRSIGGTIDIHSAPGDGMQVQIRIQTGGDSA